MPSLLEPEPLRAPVCQPPKPTKIQHEGRVLQIHILDQQALVSLRLPFQTSSQFYRITLDTLREIDAAFEGALLLYEEYPDGPQPQGYWHYAGNPRDPRRAERQFVTEEVLVRSYDESQI